MSSINARSVRTFFIAGICFLSLPVVVFFGFRFFMARLITRDNAGIVFDQFQATLDHGAQLRDGALAAEVADRAYRDHMNQTPLDGWGKPFRIDGTITGETCILTILSAGPDGAFGTADDLSLNRSYDLTQHKAIPTQP